MKYAGYMKYRLDTKGISKPAEISSCKCYTYPHPPPRDIKWTVK